MINNFDPNEKTIQEGGQQEAAEEVKEPAEQASEPTESAEEGGTEG